MLVERVEKIIEGKIINPFKTTNQTDILNISTGATAIPLSRFRYINKELQH